MPRLLVALLALILAGPARADAARDALAEIARCADIAEAAARLRCFDAAAPHARSALAAPAPANKGGLLDWFGFGRPRQGARTPEEFGEPPRSAISGELTEITAGVVEIARTVYGRSIFMLDNGQIWRQLDADDTDVRGPAQGRSMKVTIERGMLGSYNLTIEGRNPAIKVYRLK